MPKSKRSALRGPKLFGKLGPVEHSDVQTKWRRGTTYAEVKLIGRRWEFDYFDEKDHSFGDGDRGYDSRETAIVGMERSLERHAAACERLGREPK